MTNNRKTVDEYRQESTLKSLYYNRYFIVRYMTVFFFFVNLYWLFMLLLSVVTPIVVLPIGMLLICSLAMWEHTRMFTTDQRQPKWSLLCYRSVIVVNSCLTIGVLSNQIALLFPFFNTNDTVKYSLLASLLVGICIAIALLKKLYRIKSNTDAQYKRIQNYLKQRT